MIGCRGGLCLFNDRGFLPGPFPGRAQIARGSYACLFSKRAVVIIARFLFGQVA